MLAAYVIPAGWPRRLSHGFWGKGTGQGPVIGRAAGAPGAWGRQRRWLDGITNSVNVNLSKLLETVKEGSLTCCSPWGHRVSRTWLSD